MMATAGAIPASRNEVRNGAEHRRLDAAAAELAVIKQPMDKYLHLRHLKLSDSALYYSLLFDQTQEILPFIYTPTVGTACELYHTLPITTEGLYLRITDKGNVLEKLRERQQIVVQVIVVTDGERILGLGDLGANGMGISEGKITLYTAAAGVNPGVCLPMALDMGTNNKQLREHPQYKGLKRERADGAEYDEFIAELVSALKEWQPHLLVQWEDFGNNNAFRILERYQHDICCFNDDIQGTACITLAALLSALRVQKEHPCDGDPDDWKVVFLGAGEAGVGIGELIAYYCSHRLGQPVEEARKRCIFVDSKGLVCSSRDNLQPHKQKFAHEIPHQLDLKATLRAHKPQALIGVSTIAGSFDQEVVELMSSWNKRPIIMPLSNPTPQSECTFQQAWEWSDGNVLFASGSAFDPITSPDGTVHTPSQANNAYIFPAVGHAAVLTQCRSITTELFLEAAESLSQRTSLEDAARGRLFPPFHEILEVSADIMSTVCDFIVQQGLGRLPDDKSKETRWREYCKKKMWTGHE